MFRLYREPRKQHVVATFRAFLFAICAVAVLAACSSHSGLDTAASQSGLSASGLTGGYPFDEGSGTTTADVSANHINGTLTNGPTWGLGKYGNAIVLDGVNDFVDLGNPTPLKITGSMTLSAWINTKVFPVDDAAIVSKRNNQNLGFQLDTTIDTGPRTVGFKLTSSSGGSMFRYGATTLQTNRWYHVAGVYDATAKTLNVYVNGVLDNGTLTGTVTTTQKDSTLNVNIGRRPGKSGFEFNGSIDDVRIYARALSAAEIQTDMNNPAGAAPDTTPPTVSVTAPAANTQVGGSVSVTANATDDTGVAGVQFLLDGTNLGTEATSSPYAVTWDTTAVANGTHVLTARARDAAGNATTSAPISVTVSNPPKLTISQPSEGASVAGTTVNVTYAVTGDTSQVSQLQFQLDGGIAVYDPTVDGSFQLSAVSPGAHTLQAVLVRNDLSALGSSITVHFSTTLPDTAPPTVAVTSPVANATVTSAITITATASDNVGVAGVQFLLDGASIGAEVTTPAYSLSWDSGTVANGSHTLAARARDAAGNTATSAGVTITVSNTQTTGLTAGYAFDEGAGTSAHDVSVNGITGTLASGATWGSGEHGGAVSLNGASAVVSLGNPTPLKLTGSMTLSAWINASAFPADDAAVISKRDGGETGFQLDTTLDRGPRTVGFKLTSSSGANMFRYGNTVLATNTWYHVAGVYDATAKTLNVYVNGVLDNGALIGTITTTQGDSTQNVVIGQRPGKAGFGFNGRVDDARIYARALSQAEIANDMAASLGAPPDTTPPMVSITSPQANTQVAGTVNVTASASDDTGVAGVQFLLDGATIGAEETSGPYSVSWNTTTGANGPHTLSARARDAAGNVTTSASVAVTVFNPPLLTFIQPVEGQTISGSTINIQYGMTGDLSQVDHVHFTLDGGGVLMDMTLDGVFQITGVGPGAHTLQGVLARADHTDITGSNATVHFTTTLPDTTPPTVSITAPASGANVTGTVQVSATAADDVAVAGVQLLLDGVNLGAEMPSAPYGMTWDTHSVANGSHTLSARARDTSGNATTSSGVTVNVQNAVTSGSITAAYTFDEGTGTTAADVSANHIVGTLTNGATWASGHYGNALSLDGHGYVDLGNPAPLKITGSMTISAWIYSTSFPNDDAAIVSKRGAQVGFQFDTTIDQGPRSIGFKLTNSSNADMLRYGHTTLQTNTWYHVAGVYDATAGTMNVYLNGVLDNGNLIGTITGSQVDSTMNVNVGRRPGSAGFEFPGRIDDVRIYNRALSQAEIQSDMNTPLGGAGDTTPPQVALTAPAANATVAGIVTITATATDDSGIANVQFFSDGAPLGAQVVTPPYQFAWDTQITTNGAHNLWVTASDFAGHTTTSAVVAVQVNNVNYFQNEVLLQGLSLPTVLKFLPDGRLLIGLLGGKIVILQQGASAVDATPFLQLTNIGTLNGQQGLMDILLDPNFATNGWYYIFYTLGSPNRDRVSRFTAQGSTTDLSTELVLWQDDRDANAEHHGGALNFGNDGKLYITTGEAFDPPEAQDLTTYRGKVLRINADGTIPTDNPFADGSGPNKEETWALGLRNPYRAYWDLPSGVFFIGNVGGNDYSTAIEELNIGKRGANYGWPNCEGPCNNPAYVDPTYWYAHNGRDACITSGFVYHGTQFPSDYRGSYFFADYVQNWIKRLTFDSTGKVTAVYNFEPLDGSADGPWGDIVYMTESPDGSLYYIDLGYEDSTGATDISKIRRIRYVAANQAPSAVASATPTTGPSPLTVQFSSAGSVDPEGAPLTFSWDFGDNSKDTTASPTHQYVTTGTYTVRLTVSDGVNTQLADPLTIAVGVPPVPTIFSPTNGSKFRAGDVIAYSGDATDTKDGTLPASAFTWQALFHHSTHVHPATPVSGSKSGTYPIATTGHDFSGTTYYEFVMTVVNSQGLSATTSTFIYPDKVNLNFDSVPTGLTLHIDGIPYTTPFVHDDIINFQHTIDAPDQSANNLQYTFKSWSDGGAWSHVITVPTQDVSLVATYNQSAITLPPGLAAAYNLNATSGTNASDASGNNNTATLNGGGTWTTGQYGGALHFDGTSGYLAVPNSPTLDITGNALTLAMWLNLDTTSNVDSVVLGKFWSPTSMASPYYQYGIELSGGTEPYFYIGTAGGPLFAHLGSALPLGTWTHLAVVFDGSTATFYVNGTAMSPQPLAANIVARGNAMAIGADNAPQQFLRGAMDEVRVYQRALSAAEVRTDMNTAY